MAEQYKSAEFDFDQGVAVSDIQGESIVSSQTKGKEILLIKRGNEYFTIGSSCTHYSDR